MTIEIIDTSRFDQNLAHSNIYTSFFVEGMLAGIIVVLILKCIKE